MSEQSTEQKRKLPSAAIAGIVLAAICAVALYIRIALPYDEVFVNGWVWFRETDAYYYMRHIENMVHNFPRFNAFDPYMLYPDGGVGLYRPFFVWLVAGVTRLVSWGPPTQHTIGAVGAYMPAILGTLTLIPVYFIGKELFNRWVGLISAALVAILPGEFLHRSLLGFTDHHVAETLFSSLTILFLIMAIKRAREREISFHHLLHRDWSTLGRPLVYALLAGVFLGIYLLSWVGGLLLIFIIFAYLLIQFVVDHLRHRSTDYLCLVGTPLFLAAFLMLLPILGGGSRDMAYRASMLVAIVAPVVLSILSRLMAGRAWKPAYYPLALLGLAGIGLAALYAISPSLLQYMRGLFGIFAPAGPGLTVMEMQPILRPLGSFSLRIAWANFTTSFFISFVSFVMLAFVVVKERSAHKTLFLIWSIVMLLAVLGQRRFGYYYAVNAALLTGYFSWKMLDLAGLGKLLARPTEVAGAVKKLVRKEKKTREKAKPGTFMQPRAVWVRVIVVGIAIFFLVFFPNIPGTRALARAPNPFMDEGWYNSLLWLKDNSPEPFADPDFYYELYPRQDEFQYPETAYGVMSWWDYGYFIMQVARRLPNANPMQAGARQVAPFFVAQSESLANELADGLGSKYVLIDHTMPTGKFYAMVEWAGGSLDEFFESYYLPTEDGGQWGALYYPAYYQSTVARLYNFDGKAVVPTESIAISYEEREAATGEKYKVIRNVQPFPTYEEAVAYIASQDSESYRIVGTNPFVSPVPLEALNSYQLVYVSDATAGVHDGSMPALKIFKYLGSGES